MSLKYGSTLLKMNSIAEDLSKVKWADSGLPMFNVTLLTEKDTHMKAKKSDTFDVIEWNYVSGYINLQSKLNWPYFVYHENRVMDDLLRSQKPEYVELLKSKEFDGALGTHFGYECIISKSLGLPYL